MLKITQPARRRHLKVHFLLSQRDLLIFAEQLNLRTSFHEYAAAKMKITLNLTVIFRIHFMICMYHIHLLQAKQEWFITALVKSFLQLLTIHLEIKLNPYAV